jgi:hypothetical protein
VWADWYLLEILVHTLLAWLGRWYCWRRGFFLDGISNLRSFAHYVFAGQFHAGSIIISKEHRRIGRSGDSLGNPARSSRQTLAAVVTPPHQFNAMTSLGKAEVHRRDTGPRGPRILSATDVISLEGADVAGNSTSSPRVARVPVLKWGFEKLTLEFSATLRRTVVLSCFRGQLKPGAILHYSKETLEVQGLLGGPSSRAGSCPICPVHCQRLQARAIRHQAFTLLTVDTVRRFFCPTKSKTYQS